MDGSSAPAAPFEALNERELKLVVADDLAIPDLGGLIPGATLGRPRRKRVRDVYFDTDDLRLARWGVTFRWRRGDGWTVKLPRPSAGAMLDRDEITFESSATQPPQEAVSLVASLTRGAPLVQVAEIANDRTVRVWNGDATTTSGDGDAGDGAPGDGAGGDEVDGDGAPGIVAEMVDDLVVATTTAGEVRFRELEVELAPGVDGSILGAILAAIPHDDGVRAIPKLVRALGPAAAAPPDVVVPEPGEAPTGAEVIHVAIAAAVTRLLLHLPGVRLGIDPTGVHQARVATRRLRSDLRTFGPLLDRDWASGLRAELSWLGEELGRVRDADVLDGILRAALDRHPGIDRTAAERLLAILHDQRAADRATLIGHLDDERTLTLLDHLVDAAASPRVRRRARHPAAEILPPLVERSWLGLHRAVEALEPEPAVADLHQIRILAKRVRYASEAVVPASGADAVAFARAAASIQDSLGALNDADVAGRWLAATARRLRGGAAFAAGQLAQQLEVDALDCRSGWTTPHRKMVRREAWLQGRAKKV